MRFEKEGEGRSVTSFPGTHLEGGILTAPLSFSQKANSGLVAVKTLRFSHPTFHFLGKSQCETELQNHRITE